ncbi:hypothetical protein BT69DRAFT_535007 [Atractiella rhizophila]|nr:hypothetical protein BT69DRAFT_535007 [Atractiella rhizophila]
MDENVAFIISLGLIFFFIHWLSKRPSTPSTARAAPRRQVPQSKIDQVASMFPTLSTGSIKYELEKNGANVERAVEKILLEGFLPEPPAGWFGEENPPPRPAAPAQSNNRSTAMAGTAVKRETLISRLGMEAKVEEQDAAWKEAGIVGVRDWTEALPDGDLKERKVRMVLDARRKLLEKDERVRRGET